MSKIDFYTLSLKALNIGKYSYDYELDDSFFKEIEAKEFDKGNIKAHVEVIRNRDNVELKFHLRGEIESICDRCLAPLMIPVDVTEHIYVKFGDRYEEESDELIVIPEDEGTFNIAWLMYEFVALSLPMVRMHEEGECDSEMMKIYKQHIVSEVEDGDADSDFDIEERENNEVDPRWAALKNILDNNKD